MKTKMQLGYSADRERFYTCDIFYFPFMVIENITNFLHFPIVKVPFFLLIFYFIYIYIYIHTYIVDCHITSWELFSIIFRIDC